MVGRLVLLTVIFCVFSGKAAGQFSGKSDIPVVELSGYYHLSVSPDVLAVAQDNLADIRIRNRQSGEEISYLLRTENPVQLQSSFEYYQLLQNDFNPNDSITSVVIDNEGKKTVDQFCVIIRNADISKFISVKGSEDKLQWYAVKQTSRVNTIVKNDENSEILIVDIPKGDYRYYVLEISNPQHEPVKVLHVGKYQYSEILGKYTRLPVSGFVRKDSTNKKSYIYFTAVRRNYIANRISFEINNDKPFRRETRLMSQEISKDKKALAYPIRSFVLSSENEHSIELGNTRLNKSLFLEIDNKDNIPLAIQEITFYQLNRYLTVYLEKGVAYTLFCGDKKLSAPEYDIRYFEQNIPESPPILELQLFEEIAVSDEPDPAKSPNFMETPLFLWSVIAIVGIVLLWICFRMIRETKKVSR
jgi:hypothetical protein